MISWMRLLSFLIVCGLASANLRGSRRAADDDGGLFTFDIQLSWDGDGDGDCSTTQENQLTYVLRRSLELWMDEELIRKGVADGESVSITELHRDTFGRRDMKEEEEEQSHRQLPGNWLVNGVGRTKCYSRLNRCDDEDRRLRILEEAASQLDGGVGSHVGGEVEVFVNGQASFCIQGKINLAIHIHGLG